MQARPVTPASWPSTAKVERNRLNNSVAVPAKQPWSRADKLAAGTLAVAFAGLLVAVRFGLVAHRDAQEPADKPTVSISRTL